MCSILIIWNNVNASMPEVLSPSKASKFTCPKVEPKPKRKKSRPTQPGSNLKRRFGIKHNVALLMAVTVLILNVIAWRATEETGTADGA